MNLKSKVIGLFAAAALSMSLVAPLASAQTTGSGVVNVGNSGSFNAYFCRTLSFGTVSVNSYEDQTKSGALEICYNDTQNYRDGFKVTVKAGDFDYQGVNPWNVGEPVIPAENLEINTIYNPHQGQWGGPSSTPPNPIDVGDLGGWAGTNGAVTDHANPKSYGGDKSLDNARAVAYAWDGAGTASGVNQPVTAISGVSTGTGYVNGTYQGMSVDLTIPAGLPGGLYQSTLTLTIIPGEGTP